MCLMVACDRRKQINLLEGGLDQKNIILFVNQLTYLCGKSTCNLNGFNLSRGGLNLGDWSNLFTY